MIDTHCHLDDSAFHADLPDALARARACGVTDCVLAGIDPDGWRAQAAVAAAHPGLWVMYGLHPRWVAGRDPAEVARGLDALSAALRGDAPSRSPSRARLVALGEIGLDRTRHVPPDSVPQQEAAFRDQLALARALDLPVSLHVVRAHGLALDLMRRDGLPRAGGAMHSYSGPAELVADFCALGLMISFSGAVSVPAAKKLRRAAAVVPDAHLLIETDAPDLTPLCRQPARNEPAFLCDVRDAVAGLRGQSPDHVAALTARNARALFRLDAAEGAGGAMRPAG